VDVLSDPAREPVLEPAPPEDAVPDKTVFEDTEAMVKLRDGQWVYAQVIGQRKGRSGLWHIGLRWIASPAIGGREGWFLYSACGVRRLNREDILRLEGGIP
jgi:hypothetical protein